MFFLFLKKIYARFGFKNAEVGSSKYKIHSFLKNFYPTIIFLYRRWGRFSYLNKYLNFDGSVKLLNDLDVLLYKQNKTGFALISFMGCGDYLFVTPLIERIRKYYPYFPIHLYVSSSLDQMNSPTVGVIAQTNPNLNKVLYYNGKMQKKEYNFHYYDITDALDKIPSNLLVIPLIYAYPSESLASRTKTSLKIFNFHDEREFVYPILYPNKNKQKFNHIISKMSEQFELKSKGIIALHLETRSTDYKYPYKENLMDLLLNEGFIILNLNQEKYFETHDRVFSLPKEEFDINDVVDFIYQIFIKFKNNFSFIAVNSVFWPISSAFNIPTFGIHIFYDSFILQYWYPNISLLTHFNYKNIPSEKLFIATEDQFEKTSTSLCDFFIFKPVIIVEKFMLFLGEDKVND